MNISAATVHYNTPELLLEAYNSIRRFYPRLHITVMDGSNSALMESGKNLIVNRLGYNIGHGPGMHKAITECETDFILLFDTDIVMKEPCIEKMLELMEEDTFAVGEIQMVEKPSYGVIFSEEPYEIPLVHPYFHIVQVKEYAKYLPYTKSGGPVGLTTCDIFSRKLSDKVLKNFNVRQYVNHRWGGTRSIVPIEEYECPFLFTDEINKKLLENWNNAN